MKPDGGHEEMTDKSKSGRNGMTSLRVVSLLSLSLGLIIAIYAVSGLAGESTFSWLNKFAPAVMMLLLMASCVWIVKLEPLSIWTPLPWFLVANSVYFGFGPLVYHHGAQETINSCHSLFHVSESQLLRTNTLNAIGIVCVLLGFLLSARLSGSRGIQIFRDKKIISKKLVVAIFIMIGLPVKYLLYMPYIFGMSREILPYSIGQFQNLTFLSIIPLMGLVSWRAKGWLIVLILVVISEIFFTVLEFSKASLLITLIMVVLGKFYYDSRIRILVVGGLLVMVAFLSINPVIPYARSKIVGMSGNHYTATLSQRADIMKDFFSSQDTQAVKKSFLSQGFWVRLNYANAQSFSMDQYDRGIPGKSFWLCAYSPIPRFLWPGKPSIVDVGVDYCELLAGDRNSSYGAGFYAEAYWNGGYLLVIASCLFVGVLFAIFSAYSTAKMSCGSLIFLPVIFWGMRMGFRPDGWFVIDYFGPIFICVFTHFLIKFINSLLIRVPRVADSSCA